MKVNEVMKIYNFIKECPKDMSALRNGFPKMSAQALNESLGFLESTKMVGKAKVGSRVFWKALVK